MAAPAIDIVLHISLEYWWMFFVAFVIATVGNATGLGGGPFFSSIFLLVMHLPPQVAVGTSMLTKSFGLSSGSYAFWKKDMIDFAIAKKLLIVAVPLAIIGSRSSGEIQTFARACSRSAIRSSTSSKPRASRTRLSTMPMDSRYATG